ncbi:flagellar hook-associated protein FlgL [Geodermatophilus sp. DSM 44513]|uniref:flagellar hook-associated protein FlgL n=1 Tax=Geodermatophilus sp. DSM 44513 TaxID=1528104 RepID=UPI00128658E7|nr:flagellar hook-associated protein FlgL [Geodermatophilus sp. DSM 44513]WNV76478.1 flagellar hook-associated protein FlgL [Geodermatophilus sp. DSM 44513]
MRITQRAVALTSLQGLNRNLDAVGRLQQQLTSGRSISKPSDSPTGTNTAMRTRGEQSANERHVRSITDAQSRLAATDTTLSSMLTQVRRVRDQTVYASNTGALSATSREGIAVEVEQLRESLLGLANQTVNGRPVFGGTTSSPVAYDGAGAYVGAAVDPADEATQVMRRLSDTERVRADVTGAEAFELPGPGGRNLFTVLDDLAVAIRSGVDIDLADGLTDLDAVRDQMITAAADVGARAKRVDDAQGLAVDRSLSLTDRLARTENIDLPRTIMELEMQKVGYEAALAATAKALQPTLVDFLS